MDILSPIESIPRISPIYRKRLVKLGIKNIRDLFYHFPFRYDDFSNIKSIDNLKLGETATIQGKIIEIKNTRTWKKRIFITEIYIQDETGIIKAIWFNQPYLIDTLKEGDLISLAGKVNFDKELNLSNPAYEKIPTANADQSTVINLRHTGGLIPVYPETTGLSSRWLRYIIKLLLPKFLLPLKDHLPLEIKRSQGLIDLGKAIEQIHFPKTKKQAEAAKKRLAFDELFLIQLSVLEQKVRWQKQSAPKIIFDQELVKNFVGSLPFKLTNAQRRSAWEILQDLEKPEPMNRLLEGDVGSGKTVVAAIAALQTFAAGKQIAFMAPTEILAQQHFKTLTNLFINQKITVGLLTGNEAVISKKENPPQPSSSEGNSSPPLEKAGSFDSESLRLNKGDLTRLKKSDFLKQISSGQIQILIGTHALIQKTVKFKNLALVILDEQHRFGVEQRAALQKKVLQIKDGSPNTTPHLLSMTATPIPRTLALTVFGDLDISLLDELPQGRQEIITKIVAPQNRQKAYEFIRQQVKQERQVFVICPRIEIAKQESPTLLTLRQDERGASQIESQFDAERLAPSAKRLWDDVKAVKEEYEKLSKIIFPDFKIAILHGKIKSKEKEKIMSEFKSGESNILVSTSVIEVGIDIPNATVMMIEGAERFGLAQLHQFRGRIGRGAHQSYCFLFTTSGAQTARLKALITCKTGFELAEEDMAIRGPGEFYGTRQWGLPDLSMASLSDLELVKNVREEAQKIISKDPELKTYPLLSEKLQKFQTSLHLE